MGPTAMPGIGPGGSTTQWTLDEVLAATGATDGEQARVAGRIAALPRDGTPVRGLGLSVVRMIPAGRTTGVSSDRLRMDVGVVERPGPTTMRHVAFGDVVALVETEGDQMWVEPVKRLERREAPPDAGAMAAMTGDRWLSLDEVEAMRRRPEDPEDAALRAALADAVAAIATGPVWLKVRRPSEGRLAKAIVHPYDEPRRELLESVAFRLADATPAAWDASGREPYRLASSWDRVPRTLRMDGESSGSTTIGVATRLAALRRTTARLVAMGLGPVAGLMVRECGSSEC